MLEISTAMFNIFDRIVGVFDLNIPDSTKIFENTKKMESRLKWNISTEISESSIKVFEISSKMIEILIKCLRFIYWNIWYFDQKIWNFDPNIRVFNRSIWDFDRNVYLDPYVWDFVQNHRDSKYLRILT